MINKYYLSQKNLGYLFLVIGVLSILISFYFLITQPTLFYIGISIPFIAIGIYHLFISFNYIVKYSINLNNVKQQVIENKVKEGEIDRITKQISLNVYYNFLFIFLILTSTILLFGFSENQFLRGLGISIFVHATILITAQYSVNQKRIFYLKWLNDFYN